MHVHIRFDKRAELSVQIYRQLLDAVLDGRLRSGQRLPPTRDFARQLKVARNTVARAYERLIAEGILVGRTGAGTFVGRESLLRIQGRRAPAGAVLPRAVWRAIPSPKVSSPISAAYDFSVGTPDLNLFPAAIWRRLVARALRAPTATYGQYGDPRGYVGLRTAIARHIGVSRAVKAAGEDVLVTQGAQQAFDLIGRVLLAEGDTVAVEEPGYSYVRRVFESLGARVLGVPVDAEGIDVNLLPKRARLIYVTPSHQFPLGTVMSLRRRASLLDWAEQRGAVIIEDDYDSEFKFGDRALDPLQSLDRAGRVVYVGSFSKVLMPALRHGFLIAPASLQSALLTAKHLTSWHGESGSEVALARFIDEGFLARHIRQVTREYSSRFDQTRDSIERRLGRHLRLLPSMAGLHVTATLLPGTTARLADVVRRARARGVKVSELSDFFHDASAQRGLVIGFGGITAARIDGGIKELAACFISRRE